MNNNTKLSIIARFSLETDNAVTTDGCCSSEHSTMSSPSYNPHNKEFAVSHHSPSPTKTRPVTNDPSAYKPKDSDSSTQNRFAAFWAITNETDGLARSTLCSGRHALVDNNKVSRDCMGASKRSAISVRSHLKSLRNIEVAKSKAGQELFNGKDHEERIISKISWNKFPSKSELSNGKVILTSSTENFLGGISFFAPKDANDLKDQLRRELS
mmetsp:Transcript_28314/g.40050  ORF Transcript_28314/g.40050 Transcript_28314/m.40050 type:complete len:212 (+) Transcript_28314:57-692(+)|eukprot:CAMPEP_0202442424 /NCGR_PEP_ID=MMETSP1360-20130828/1891_1 /ASSEMBLY_ACC=CAM_ASM_000848 /TAXON_ID=515479 /ORGANISM="Licmophora paradoxa, Strain CCMP2313" /LENGTH=211 /DNA_ID=CAMNT_0049057805 /DNA_START=45 /DNA_END=683 /DNA_ORIENTATION=-